MGEVAPCGEGDGADLGELVGREGREGGVVGRYLGKKVGLLGGGEERGDVVG